MEADTARELTLLRPWALVLLVPLLILAWQHLNRLGRTPWREACDPRFLPHLLLPARGGSRWPVPVFLLAGLLAIAALAGPAWEKQPRPVFEPKLLTVIVVKAAPSMEIVDLPVSRLDLARAKARTFMDHLPGGQVALILYAGEAYTALPFTDDSRVVNTMLAGVDGTIMPLPGDNPDRALRLAQDMLARFPDWDAQVLLITDGPGQDSAATARAARELDKADITFNIVAVGGSGGLIQKPLGGHSIIGPIDREGLEAVAQAGGGAMVVGRVGGDGELGALLRRVPDGGADQSREAAESVPVWFDGGVWLLPALVVLASLAFRKGLILALLVALFPILGTVEARAQIAWEGFWRTPDQRAYDLLKRKEAAAAAELFEDGAWRGVAQFRAELHPDAAQTFAEDPELGARYNEGNALAHAQRFTEAIERYEKVLEQDPDHDDARHNRDVLKKLLEDQKPPPSGNSPQNQGQGQNNNQNQQGQGQNQQAQGQNQQGQGQKPQGQAGQQGPSGGQQGNSAPGGSMGGSPPPGQSGNGPMRTLVVRGGSPGSGSATGPEAPLPGGAGIRPGGAEPDKRPPAWILQVQDDPAALLKEKFRREAWRRRGVMELKDMPLGMPPP